MKSMKHLLATIFCIGVTFNLHANPLQASYHYWPDSPDWVEMTNHISWCYRSLVQRLDVLGASAPISPAQITPTYIYPYRDYQKFAWAIDQLAPKFVHSKKDLVNYFRTPITGSVYPYSFPMWTAESLHLQSFGQTTWSTNLLHSWCCLTNYTFQFQVQSAISNLNTTWQYSEEFSNPIYTVCISNCDLFVRGDPYPSAGSVNNDFSGIKNCMKSNFGQCIGEVSSVRYVQGEFIYEEAGLTNPLPHAIYAAAAAAVVNSNNFNLTYSIYGFRAFAQPVLSGVYNQIHCTPSWYLWLERHPRYTNSTIDKLYYIDFDSIPFEHMVLANSVPRQKQSAIYGGYAKESQSMQCGSNIRNKNPIDNSSVYSFPGYGHYSQNAYCIGAYWILRWDMSELVGHAPAITFTNAIQNYDVNWDGIVDAGVDIASLGNDFGTITYLPQCEKPVVVLPLGTPPAWYQGIPINAYLTGGNITNYPFQYLLPDMVDDDGYNTAYSLNTRVLESNASGMGASFRKRVSILRPNGNIVVFQFYNSESSGRPIGVNSNRTYLLWDETPDLHKDKNYKLSFDSGILHCFGSDGKLQCIEYADGLVLNTSVLPGYSVQYAAYGTQSGPNSITAQNAKYNVSLSWNADALQSITYTPVGTSTHITTTIGRDSKGKIQSLANNTFSENNAVYAPALNKITYGTGASITQT